MDGFLKEGLHTSRSKAEEVMAGLAEPAASLPLQTRRRLTALLKHETPNVHAAEPTEESGSGYRQAIRSA